MIGRILNITTLLVITIGCGVVGYYIGDIVYDKLTEVRLSDWVGCRIGIPIFLMGIAFIPGIVIGQAIEDKIWKTVMKRKW